MGEEFVDDFNTSFDAEYLFKVGDVVLIQNSGHGFVKRDVGKYVEVTGYGDYYGEVGVTVKEFDKPLETVDYEDDCVVGYGTFGKNPMILMNINDEHVVDPDYVAVAEGSKEEVDKALGIKRDMVNKPSHYRLTDGFEVKDLMKLVLDNIEQNMEMSHFKASCYKEMLQYLIRAPLKNGWEDIEKAQFYLNEVLKKDD